MINEKISVVTPSFNQGQFLESTIRSVLEQSYENVEYIVIDGKSSDNSPDIIKKYAGRLTYWCSEPDEGQTDAIRKGFERASGDILCWLNSDDIFLPGALCAVASYFERHPNVEAVSSGAVIIDDRDRVWSRGKCVYTLGIPATFNRLRFYGQGGVAQCATFWRRRAYEAVGGIDCDYDFIMDLDLFTRLAQRRRFGVLRKLTACYRIHPAAKGSTIQDVHHHELSLFRKRYCNTSYDTTTGRFHRVWHTFTMKIRRGFLAARWEIGKAIGRPVFRELPTRTD